MVGSGENVRNGQRPPTAKGFAFYVLEDGPNRIQLIISPDLWEKERGLLRDATMMIASGWLDKKGRAWTMRADKLIDTTFNRAPLD